MKRFGSLRRSKKRKEQDGLGGRHQSEASFLSGKVLGFRSFNSETTSTLYVSKHLVRADAFFKDILYLKGFRIIYCKRLHILTNRGHLYLIWYRYNKYAECCLLSPRVLHIV